MTPHNLFRTPLLLLVVGLILPGCQPNRENEVRDLMAQFRWPKRIEFLTIQPNSDEEVADTDTLGKIGGFPIIDSRINGPGLDQLSLAAAFENTVTDGISGMAADCFNPRYALRLPDDPDTYILICFECSSARYSYGDVKGSMPINGDAYSGVFRRYVEEFGMTTSDN